LVGNKRDSYDAGTKVGQLPDKKLKRKRSKYLIARIMAAESRQDAKAEKIKF